MTRSENIENIMSRWSRMKRESDRTAEPDGSFSGPKPNEAEAGDLNQATVATPPTDSPASAIFDLASLPPLQSITAGTDIRSFLGSSVPVELTKAALRRAWVADPAIRDFIGIAENQWDFNDPTAMPDLDRWEPTMSGLLPVSAKPGRPVLRRPRTLARGQSQPLTRRIAHGPPSMRCSRSCYRIVLMPI